MLVCLDDGPLVALDRSDGDTVWEYDRKRSPSTRPAIAHGNVYLPAGNGIRTRCLDLESGTERWNVRTSGYWTQPTAVADGVYFGTPNEGLFAVAPDRSVEWHDEDWRIDGPIAAVVDQLYVIPYTGPSGNGGVHTVTN